LSGGVTLVISDLGGGGAQKVFVRLANSWAEAGREVSVVTLAGLQADRHRLHPSIRRVTLDSVAISSGPLSAIMANFRRIAGLRRILRDLSPRVAIGFIAPTNILLILAARGLGCRIVVSERNDPGRQSFGKIWDWLRRTLYRQADLVTANSVNALDALGAYVPREQLLLVPNPLDIPVDPPPAAMRATEIIAVGRLHAQKGYDILLPAFAEVRARWPNWTLRILGTGDLRNELQGQAASLGLTDAVIWNGYVEDPAPYYRNAAIFVLPSRFEGMPNALLEAMANGLPSVVSDAAGGALDFVEQDVSGILVPSGDSGMLAAALMRLVGSQELRADMGAAARARIQAMPQQAANAAWQIAIGED